jgi:hypothetical protein
MPRLTPIALGMSALWAGLSDPLVSGGGADNNKYLDQRGGKVVLKAALQARDEQASENQPYGRKWVIHPEGDWATYRYVLQDGKEVLQGPPERTGRLDQAELVALAAKLHEHRLDELPSELGTKPTEGNYDPGAFSYHIQFGPKKTAAYHLQPRRGTRDIQGLIMRSRNGDADHDGWRRFAALARLIEETCRPGPRTT